MIMVKTLNLKAKIPVKVKILKAVMIVKTILKKQITLKKMLLNDCKARLTHQGMTNPRNLSTKVGKQMTLVLDILLS